MRPLKLFGALTIMLALLGTGLGFSRLVRSDQAQRPTPPLRSDETVSARDRALPAEATATNDPGHIHDRLESSLHEVTMAAAWELDTGWGSWSGWSTWCETDHMRPCTSNQGCNAGERCVHPWWLEGDETVKTCVEAWPTEAKRGWRRDRLRTIVDFVCSRRDGCDRRQLHGFLSLVALRESTWRPQKRHRLNPDLEAALAAWRRRAKIFEGSAHYSEIARWSTGLGMYGQNPAIFVDAWDRTAPPEVLCREVEATAAYLERSRRAVRGFTRRKITPTLCDVHHAVAGGKLEPCADEGPFRRRAARIGLDADRIVTEASFGRPHPRSLEAKIAWADAIRSAVDAVHPPL